MAEFPFQPTHVIRLSELPAAEKELYFDLLVDNDATFHQDEAGRRIADIRILAPGIKKTNTDKAKSPRKARLTPLEKLKRLAATTPEELTKTLGTKAVDGKEFDMTEYPRFAAYVVGSTVQPKKRALTWVMKLIEEIYDARYTHDITDLQKEDASTDPAERDSAIFPIFVLDHISKRYGLQKLVDQTAWDLLYTVHCLRKNHLEIEIFAQFLQEWYDPDDLLFFMYLRSVIQKLLNVSFKNRWGSESTRGPERTPKQLWLSYRECVTVARTVFGNEDDAMYKDFLTTIESQAVGKKRDPEARQATDSRRIEVTQLFHLAVVGYHETRPEEEAGPGPAGAPGDGMGDMAPVGGGGDGLSDSEQQALFREAQLMYQARMKVLEDAQANTADYVDPALKEEMRTQEMEDALRQVMSRGIMGGAPDDQQVKVWAAEMLSRQDDLAPMPPPAPPAATDGYNLDQVDSYLENIARDRGAIEEMEKREQMMAAAPTSPGAAGGSDAAPISVQDVTLQCEEKYVNDLMEQASALPDEVVSEIRAEVANQLHEKVAFKLDQLGDLSTLRPEEMVMVMERVLLSPDIGQEIESLVTLLVTYAANRLQSMM